MMRAVLGGAGLLLLGALYRQRRRVEALQAQLEASAADLEHLQTACARLAPAGVVQKLIADSADADTGAERKVVTALFADLVGYAAKAGGQNERSTFRPSS
jgi:class 3 adenylate cyclase